MNGHLSEHPLAELIQEIGTAHLTGALRLERERVKVVVYFEEGKLVYATSNLRGHRLVEVIKRSGLLTEAQLNKTGAQNDAELAGALLKQGLLQPPVLETLRIQQVSDVLRPALLWIDGHWSYDGRVRLAEEMRVAFDPKPLLMEGARRMPPEFIGARFRGAEGTFAPVSGADNGIKLSSDEASLLSRIAGPMTIPELKALTNPNPNDALCIAYTLALGGFLQRSSWPIALVSYPKAAQVKTTAPVSVAASPAEPVVDKETAARELEQRQVTAMLNRLSQAENHYEVLDIGREATPAEIKRAYHGLARSFHPDKFHKSLSRKRHSEVEAAFARFAQAYETLANPSLRSAYDAKLGNEPAAVSVVSSPAAEASTQRTTNPMEAYSGPRDRSYAEMRFQQGLEALKQENFMLAVRCFAEAANLAPEEAKYRGYYGSALSSQPQARRQAEAELMAAISLDPANASYHVMMARLYRDLGFSRRAQTELEKALALEPGNKATQQLLSSLKKV